MEPTWADVVTNPMKKKRVYVDTKASTYSLVVAEIGKATWKMQEQFNPKCLEAKWHLCTMPPVFLLITTTLCLKTHSTSLHCVSQYQMRPTHTKTHICSEASWNNTASNDPTQKPEGGTLFRVHRKDEAIFHLMLDAACCFMLSMFYADPSIF